MKKTTSNKQAKGKPAQAEVPGWRSVALAQNLWLKCEACGEKPLTVYWCETGGNKRCFDCAKKWAV